MPAGATRRRSATLLLSALSLLVGFFVPELAGQKVVSARAGLITYVLGSAVLDGRPVVLKGTRFPQMENGSTLSTARPRGRAELLLAPNVLLRLTENSQLRMDDT